MRFVPGGGIEPDRFGLQVDRSASHNSGSCRRPQTRFAQERQYRVNARFGAKRGRLRELGQAPVRSCISTLSREDLLEFPATERKGPIHDGWPRIPTLVCRLGACSVGFTSEHPVHDDAMSPTYPELVALLLTNKST